MRVAIATLVASTAFSAKIGEKPDKNSGENLNLSTGFKTEAMESFTKTPITWSEFTETDFFSETPDWTETPAWNPEMTKTAATEMTETLEWVVFDAETDAETDETSKETPVIKTNGTSNPCDRLCQLNETTTVVSPHSSYSLQDDGLITIDLIATCVKPRYFEITLQNRHQVCEAAKHNKTVDFSDSRYAFYSAFLVIEKIHDF